MYDGQARGPRPRARFFEGSERMRAGRRLVARPRACAAPSCAARCGSCSSPCSTLPALEVVGVEALLRWTARRSARSRRPSSSRSPRRPERSCRSARGCCARAARRWPASAEQRGARWSSRVNVSARQLAEPGFALWVRQTLAHAEFPADLLTLEITETRCCGPNAVDARATCASSRRSACGSCSTTSAPATPRSPGSSTIRSDAIKIDRSFVDGLPRRRRRPRDRRGA